MLLFKLHAHCPQSPNSTFTWCQMDWYDGLCMSLHRSSRVPPHHDLPSPCQPAMWADWCGPFLPRTVLDSALDIPLEQWFILEFWIPNAAICTQESKPRNPAQAAISLRGVGSPPFDSMSSLSFFTASLLIKLIPLSGIYKSSFIPCVLPLRSSR
ncbi:hypothetical protein PM082_023084 [Marasmius tenuissimus]|nr:hypothetical protein PM082_023084 [Marasmius tenuissimus]